MNDEPLYLRYYLRMTHNVGKPTGPDTVKAYIEAHAIIRELPYKMWLKPLTIDKQWPGRTSDHYVMFATILKTREEEFEKLLFKMALKYGLEVRTKDATSTLTREPNDDEI